MTAAAFVLGLLKRNPLIVSIALALAVMALTVQTVRVSVLDSSLETAHAALADMRHERDQLRRIVERNNAAVQALKLERDALDADFAALRAEIDGMDDDTSCLDAINRALGQ